MSKLRYIILLLSLLAALSASAQPGPIFFIEHDWTFRAGGGRYGIMEWRLAGDEKYGGGRHTSIWFGNRTISMKTRTARKIEFLMALGFIVFSVLLWKVGKTEPEQSAS